MLNDFTNEPLLNFNNRFVIDKFRSTLNQVGAKLGQYYPLIIHGEEIYTVEKITSIDPSCNSQVVGYVGKASAELAELALSSAEQTFRMWSKVEPQERADYLFKAAAIMREKKYELSSWLVYEAGKNWAEADADTAEAIDFLEFYGREMYRLAGPQPLVKTPGEHNELIYIPLGVGVVIPPWNFPLAIMAGMTAAAIVAGNTVVLKPASNTPVIAAIFMNILREAGLPDGVVNYLPGSGGAIGDYLVTSPRTRFINFTGSKEVGLRINELAAKTVKGQHHIKRVSAEMGGKDAIVVDSTADLEAAATAITVSAFGYQGQKCSACSRAIIVQDVYDQVVQSVVEKTSKFTIGAAIDNHPVGPVIDKSSLNRIKSYIAIGKKEGKLLLGGNTLESLGGYYLQPTIFGDVSPDAVIAQEEIFGPVLAFIKAKDYNHALEIANNTEYGLTGAVFARDHRKLEMARSKYHVGNLYFNRKCTGALVGVHPFGGFNMSGTNSKAGGRDYLLIFLQSKVISEKY
ncbi:L-glutamate gamma-semialdehyde dehydrogenase [Desulforamulus hydrothermalis]|uniref:L-glutamate gamma-semialdehyde dehydrogenase n=1 Tax=Desulforamulus hydrothermalis Lam5 = DSM 18033 TaxID=1121428 RepID=K8EBY7_9FIRM|nr:L-glutamate gamma-semialdehyde dehydrogenase [Desulforamulus hydrothermalis]CCO09218.1 1-pyrroline-5-carboxylate dehydrogenase [Desulforamulus hydrothermalis Lam5 = DSM 18033]SHH06238.1 delta-1-pyrroline-5-carboxylate dehydrogenase [Desulforamulus hydrothermalis Lam5 = DSM 18033]